MHTFSIIQFVTFLIYIFLTIYILAKSPKSTLNRFCAVMLFCLALWCFGKVFTHRTDVPKSAAIFFSNITIIGSWLFAPCFFVFVSIFTEKRELIGKKYFLPILFLPGVFFIINQWFNRNIVDYAEAYYGWGIKWSGSPLMVYSLISYILLNIIIPMVFLFLFWKKTRSNIKNKQAKIIFISTLVPFVLGTFTNIIYPLAGKQVPDIAQNFIIIWALGLVYATVKYRLLSVSTSTAADNIISTMSDFLFLLNREGDIVTINKAAERVLFYRESELKGKSIGIVVDDKDFENTVKPSIFKGHKLKNADVRLVAKNKKIFDVSFSISFLYDQQEAVAGIICVASDISERKREEEEMKSAMSMLEVMVQRRTQEISDTNIKLQREIAEHKLTEKEKDKYYFQLLQAQKMEAVGRLTGSIAHDFNNLLTTMVGYCDLILLESNNEKITVMSGEIKKEGQRAEVLIKQLLAFSRKQTIEQGVYHLNSIITDIEKMLEHLIGEGFEMVTQLDENLEFIKVDKGQVEQIIMNLVINARDAMSGGGKIHLSTFRKELTREEAGKIEGAQPGSYIFVSVKDKGVGIREDIKNLIFEPFFTTKKAGEGSGLGLSVVYGNVKQNNGFIFVDSIEGKGSEFKVCFPAIKLEEDTNIFEETPLKALKGHGECILIVEDESAVRKFTETCLKESDYETLTAGSVNEALKVFRENKKNINMVLCDVVLSDERGVRLVQQMIEIKPELHVLFTSGYTQEQAQWDTILKMGYKFLPKPYDFKKLLTAVREALKHKSK